MKTYLAVGIFALSASFLFATDYQSVSNFCQRFTTAYNGKDVKSLEKMISDAVERKHIVNECVKRHQTIRIDIGDIEISDVIRLSGRFSETSRADTRQIGIELQLKPENGELKLVKSEFRKDSDKSDEDGADSKAHMEAARSFVSCINNGNINELSKVVLCQHGIPPGEESCCRLPEALAARKVEWVMEYLGKNQLSIDISFKAFSGRTGVVLSAQEGGMKITRIVYFDAKGVVIGEGGKFRSRARKSALKQNRSASEHTVEP